MLKKNIGTYSINKEAVLNMKYHLPDRIERELCSFAQKYSITKIVLFGSRARGTNTERSDIDVTRSKIGFAKNIDKNFQFK